MDEARIGDSEFDRDTGLREQEPGRYRIDLPEGWSIGGVLNGGYLLAVLGRAMGESLPQPHPFSVTAHYLSATRPGAASVRTEVARRRGSMGTASASLVQHTEEGAEVERIRALATYGDLDALTDEVRTAAKPPELPPYETCLSAHDDPSGRRVPPIAQRIDLRFDPATVGWAVGAPSGRGEVRAWFALADGREMDPLSLLLAVDALPPTAFDLGVSGWVPTVELTVHVRCRPAPGPVRVAVRTRNLAGGFLEEDAEVWDSQDRLVAQSRQLARLPART